MKRLPLLAALSFFSLTTFTNCFSQSIKFSQSLFSTAGFHALDNPGGRMVYSFNNGWYFYKGDAPGAFKKAYVLNKAWKQVELPHGVDILPKEASGSINYQGIVWYRKTFILPKEVKNKALSITFEAIMGKCKIWLNGTLVADHKGGYLPVVINLTKEVLEETGENVIAVMADNSNDDSYPPGKPEYTLDFAYFGGIYRDAWLVATNDVHITDANAVNKVAGGGVLVHYENVSAQSADVIVQTDIANGGVKNQQVSVETYLEDTAGVKIGVTSRQVQLQAGSSKTITQSIAVTNPALWSPDAPNLYRLYSLIKNGDEIIDGYYQNIGIRSVEFREGGALYLNGQRFDDKLVGANHHQDYAIIGNAVPNNLYWHDAKLMRDAGIRIIRGSHYPQDPAFMDACDRLGIFVIVCTPGWQFWNNDSSFVNGIYSDVRQMIRRDRNHPCVFAWEPVPNETRYPEEFAKKAYAITHAEYPFKDCIAATNAGSASAEIYDLLYGHPGEYASEQKRMNDPSIANTPKADVLRMELQKPYFTREWGDNVDNWDAQNSDSRVARSWGEVPQLVQAIHYSNPDSASRYVNEYGTSWETLYETPARHIGGALWHFFDTQRGYHPDPFYGGLVDEFRQTKYSYYVFKSQQNPVSPYFKMTGEEPYTLFIANELTPFSPADIPVFTNCDSVQLTVFGKYTATQKPDPSLKMPHAPIIFKDLYHFRDIQKTTPEKSVVVAKGYKNGQVVIETTKMAAFRPVALKLSTDIEQAEMLADGSTVIPIIASVVDEFGNVKRLNNQLVKFTVEGEGRLINNAAIAENPKKIAWGTAVALIKTNMTPGDIKIIVSPLFTGTNTIKADTLVIHTIAAVLPSIYNKNDVNNLETYGNPAIEAGQPANSLNPADKQKEQLKKVEEDQKKFQTNEHNQ
ncbi:MAG TPA: glycoside hydrolase family 2 TIM barrel-domain containing protein [Chitinophagaceae bacterium]|nr:glycoside hydrolase family 2 TIM barrel-domain containing protein [Chitinophagaceae bacterium]